MPKCSIFNTFYVDVYHLRCKKSYLGAGVSKFPTSIEQKVLFDEENITCVLGQVISLSVCFDFSCLIIHISLISHSKTKEKIYYQTLFN